MLTEGTRESEAKLVCEGRIHGLSSRPSDRLISVIVPVKNSAADLREQLPRVLSQHGDDRVEIIAIDSGSTDDTIDILQQFGATVLAIDPAAFNYGLTRNLAAGYASGGIFVFLTTRALPADKWWLSNLLAPLGRDLKIAGVFSRSIPRPDADLLTFRDYLYGFERAHGYVRAIGNWEEYRSLSPQDLYGFITYTNVSNAIRSDAFAKIPFRRRIYGIEDRLWAKDALEAGYKIQYEPSSVVLHSHNYSNLQLFQRQFDDGRGIREIVDLRLNASDVLPTILSQILSDWRYLRYGQRLTGAELDRWRIASILRRTAQVTGQWLGANEDQLASAHTAIEIVDHLIKSSSAGHVHPSLDILRSMLEQGVTDQGNLDIWNDETTLMSMIFEKIQYEWRILHSANSSDLDHLERLEIDAALSQVAHIVGGLLGASKSWQMDNLTSSLSLIAQVKSGVPTDDMGRTRPRALAQRDDVWDGDSSLRSVLDLYEAEIHTLTSAKDKEIRQLQERVAEHVQRMHDLEAEADTRHLQAQVAERDAQINILQREIDGLRASSEIKRREGERDQMIRGLQRKMGEQDQRIRELSVELDSLHRSKLWPVFRFLGFIRQTLDLFR